MIDYIKKNRKRVLISFVIFTFILFNLFSHFFLPISIIGTSICGVFMYHLLYGNQTSKPSEQPHEYSFDDESTNPLNLTNASSPISPYNIASPLNITDDISSK